MNIDVLKSGWTEYELIDSGDRLKLERFGNVTVIRSEPKAWWKPSVSDLWRNADARYLDDEKKNAKWIFNGIFSTGIPLIIRTLIQSINSEVLGFLRTSLIARIS